MSPSCLDRRQYVSHLDISTPDVTDEHGSGFSQVDGDNAVDEHGDRHATSTIPICRTTRAASGFEPVSRTGAFNSGVAASLRSIEVVSSSAELEVVRRLSDERPTIARIASDLGYSDQAQLTNEFLAVTGTTPGGYLSEKGAATLAAGAAYDHGRSEAERRRLPQPTH